MTVQVKFYRDSPVIKNSDTMVVTDEVREVRRNNLVGAGGGFAGSQLTRGSTVRAVYAEDAGTLRAEGPSGSIPVRSWSQRPQEGSISSDDGSNSDDDSDADTGSSSSERESLSTLEQIAQGRRGVRASGGGIYINADKAANPVATAREAKQRAGVGPGSGLNITGILDTGFDWLIRHGVVDGEQDDATFGEDVGGSATSDNDSTSDGGSNSDNGGGGTTATYRMDLDDGRTVEVPDLNDDGEVNIVDVSVALERGEVEQYVVGGSTSDADNSSGPDSESEATTNETETTDDDSDTAADNSMSNDAPTSPPWDFNDDGEVTVVDVSALQGRVDSLNSPAGDVNDDGSTNVRDVQALLDRVSSSSGSGSGSDGSADPPDTGTEPVSRSPGGSTPGESDPTPGNQGRDATDSIPPQQPGGTSSGRATATGGDLLGDVDDRVLLGGAVLVAAVVLGGSL